MNLDGSVVHVVGFSGGVDSQACARWVLNRYDTEKVVLLNSDAGGNEHPMTTEFVEWYSANVHPVTVVRPIVADMGNRGLRPGTKVYERRKKYRDDEPLTFEILADIKGIFPSRKYQFCTEHLKLKPQQRWMTENLRGVDWVRYTGVRRQESISRRDANIGGWDDYFACPLIQPLADWTKQMAFDYLAAHGEKVNPLYSLGFDRVGCAPCVNANKGDIRNWARRFPEMIDKVRKWEQSTGLSFFRMPRKDGSVRYVDDVVRWANTTRGGVQMDLDVLYEPPSCESQYGLCE